MAVTFTEAVAQVMAHPAPVIMIDTCNFINLFRAEDKDKQKARGTIEEIDAAQGLIALLRSQPPYVHLFVPELVSSEFGSNFVDRSKEFSKWLEANDRTQEWLADVNRLLIFGTYSATAAAPFGFANRLCFLASELLNDSEVLARDAECVNRGLDRLVHKLRPSANKEVKDAINYEQCLELCRQLQGAGHTHPRLWISSDIAAFATSSSNLNPHPDLAKDFTRVGLTYHISIYAALGSLGFALPPLP